MPDSRYAVQRLGKNGVPLSPKRIKNLTRMAAYRMAYDGFLRLFNEEDPTDPGLIEACGRIFREMERQSRHTVVEE